MSRRNKAVKRPVPPDPRFDSQTVSKFVNNLMFDGKKGVAEGIFYKAMDMIEERTGQPGVAVFKQAINNVSEYVTSTAAAIEEQSTVTNEMSTSMQRAAAEAAAMANRA